MIGRRDFKLQTYILALSSQLQDKIISLMSLLNFLRNLFFQSRILNASLITVWICPSNDSLGLNITPRSLIVLAFYNIKSPIKYGNL